MLFGQDVFAQVTFATNGPEPFQFEEWIETVPDFALWTEIPKSADGFGNVDPNLNLWEEQPKTPGDITRWEEYAT